MFTEGKAANVIVKIFVTANHREELLGDILEKHRRNRELYGAKKSRTKFYRDIIFSIAPFASTRLRKAVVWLVALNKLFEKLFGD